MADEQGGESGSESSSGEISPADFAEPAGEDVAVPIEPGTPPEPDGLSALAAAKHQAHVPERKPEPVPISMRLVAVLIDGMALFVLSLFATIALGILHGLFRSYLTYMLRPIVMLTGALAYMSFEVIGAATFGKHFVDIRIARADATPATIGRRLARWAIRNGALILLVAALPMQIADDNGVVSSPLISRTIELMHTAAWGWMAILIVGFFAIVIPGGRTLHDWLTGTAVFRSTDVKRRGGHAFQPLHVGMVHPVLPAPIVPAARADLPPVPQEE